MKATLFKRIAGIFVVFALTCLLSIQLSPQVFAQDIPELNGGGVAEATPNDNVPVGGTTIKPKDIRAAINSPTPNLANTTAYVFYTLSVIMTSSFDPTYDGPSYLEKEGSSAPSSKLHAGYPGSTSEALHRGGFIGALVYLTAEMVKNPPASSQVYLADLVQNSRFGAPVYAQGIGFGALTPILGTWKAFRDVAYYLLTIMFLVTGFLILIRHKISGNMAVTVQNALPRLVLTLIVITFSYAIAGLIVDIMFLSLYFISGIFSQYIFRSDATFSLFGGIGNRSLTELIFDTHIFTFTLGYVFNSGNGSAWGAARALGDMIWNMLDNVDGFSGFLIDAANVLAGGQIGEILGIIFAMIFGIALIIAMFRTFFALVMSYAGFVINVVLSPLILITGAIPGKNPFPGWIKNLIGGMAPFVVAVFMILMSLALTGTETQAGVGYGRTEPGTNGLRLPLILSDDIPAQSFIGILAMGFMLLLPEAVKMSKKMVGATGGIFDEYKDAAVNNFKQGWTGNKYVPGAKSLTKLGGTMAAGAGVGALAGGAYGGYKAYQGARAEGAGKATAAAAGLFGAGGGAGVGAIVGGAAYPAARVGMKMFDLGTKGLGLAKKWDEPLSKLQAKLRQDNAASTADQKAKAAQTPPPGGPQAQVIPE